MKSADNLSKFSMYGVFLITLINFLISAFSGTNGRKCLSSYQLVLDHWYRYSENSCSNDIITYHRHSGSRSGDRSGVTSRLNTQEQFTKILLLEQKIHLFRAAALLNERMRKLELWVMDEREVCVVMVRKADEKIFGPAWFWPSWLRSATAIAFHPNHWLRSCIIYLFEYVHEYDLNRMRFGWRWI